MAITVKDTVNDYIADLLVILRQFETFSGTPYYDQAPVNSKGEYQNATIGDGINIDWSNSIYLRLVLAQLGLVDSSTTLEANRRIAAGLPPETDAEKTLRLDGMVKAFQQVMVNDRPAAGADPSKANVQLQNDLNNLSALFGGGTFTLSQTLSANVVRQIIEGGVSIPDFINYPTSAGKQAKPRHRGQVLHYSNPAC